MSEGLNKQEEDGLTDQRVEDLNFVRKFWTDAGEARAKKLQKETGIPHTVADGLQEIGEHFNEMLDRAEASGTTEGQAIADVIKGRSRGGENIKE